jgi:hypothetical protein
VRCLAIAHFKWVGFDAEAVWSHWPSDIYYVLIWVEEILKVEEKTKLLERIDGWVLELEADMKSKGWLEVMEITPLCNNISLDPIAYNSILPEREEKVKKPIALTTPMTSYTWCLQSDGKLKTNKSRDQIVAARAIFYTLQDLLFDNKCKFAHFFTLLIKNYWTLVVCRQDFYLILKRSAEVI